MVVRTDAPCALNMNGDALGKLPAGITKVRVSPGQKLVSCVSSEEKVSFEGELEARSGQDTVLRISLVSRVEEARSARAAADERAAQTRREAEVQAREEAEARAQADALAKRFKALSGDVVSDTQMGVEWTRSDNGSNVNWSQGQSYCSGLEGGLKLTQFRGHLILKEEGVRNGKNQAAVSGRIQAADC